MRRRRFGWMIGLALWAVPLGGLAGLWTWARRLVSAQRNIFPDHYTLYDAPPAGWWALLAAAVVGPAIVAIWTGRGRGFAAGAALLLLGAVAGMWADGRRHRVTASVVPPAPVADESGSWYLVWDSGGVMVSHWDPPSREPAAGASPGTEARAAQRDRTLRPWRFILRHNDPATGRYARLDGWDHPPDGPAGRLGFDLAYHRPVLWTPAGGGFGFVITAPCWFLCALCLIPQAWWARAFVARRVGARRRRRGLCARCGYDLRASPEPGGDLLPRCPECGQETTPLAGRAMRTGGR